MRDKFTVEETNLMCIYDTSSRTALLNDLVTGRRDVYDPDMAAIFESPITKLEALTDEEFTDIGLYYADDTFEEFTTDGEV